MPRLFIVVNVDSFFLSHRLPIALAAAKEGYEVTIVARDTGQKEKIVSYGFRFIHVPFRRSGLNPVYETKCIWILARLYKKYKPDVVHHVALKACVLGSVAARLAGIKHVVNAVSGLGYVFIETKKGIRNSLIKALIKTAIRNRNFHYIFQNTDDISDLLNDYHSNKIHLIKGSGVDLDKFRFSEPVVKEKLHILLLARMLYDKGIIEYVEAAQRIKNNVGDRVSFILAGACDDLNPAAIPERKLKSLIDGDYIRWKGFCEDVISEIENSDIVVLPSYREGLPKSLIEACACGRPIITTDAPGCRECVEEGQNGYLVPVKDSVHMGAKLEKLINDPTERKRMGKYSRQLAEKEFSIDSVVEKHLLIYKEIIRQK